MKIVMAANWWYRRGGLGAVMLDEAAALESRGHEVVPFAAAHPANLPTQYSTWFPSFMETQDAGRALSGRARVRSVARLLYNRDAARRFGALLDEIGPAVVHLHNASRQLSPSVVSAARARHIPVVITAHDYSLICPQGQLYKADRAPCEAPNCVRGDVRHAVLNHCVKGSTSASGLAAIEHLVHRALGLYTACDLILAPSAFMARSLARAGIPARRIALLANGIDPGESPGPPPGPGGHILYSGRLGREKGLDVLLAAARQDTDVRYVVAGGGPEASRLRRAASANVAFVGHQDPASLPRLLADAVAVVMPSTWYENAPISLLEAFRAGRAVVATDLGGHPEMLASGGGVLVAPGDPGALADAVGALWRDRTAARQHGLAGRRVLERRYSLEGHIDRLLGIYDRVVAGSGS